MLGEVITKILSLVFGYVYPAVECFKTIERFGASSERSRMETENLQFWCQYWVIIAIMTAIEKLGDIFISWLPLYGECKLAFIVYLWHPRTRGTSYIYHTLLKPFMAEHETDIETRLQLIMSKSIDLLLFYFKNFTEKGQSMAFEVLHYLVSRTGRSSTNQNTQSQTPPSRSGGGGGGAGMPPPPQPFHPTAPPLHSTAPPPQPRPTGYPGSSQPRPTGYPGSSQPRPTGYTGPTGYAGAPVYPRVEEEEGNIDMQLPVNQVEEALRAAGVNLRRLRQRQ